MAGKQVSKRKRPSNESATFASALQVANRFEQELVDLRAKNLLLMAENSAFKIENKVKQSENVQLKIEIAAQKAEIAVHQGIFGVVTY